LNLTKLVTALPKAELHLHIEGTLEPELMMELAKKNNINLPYDCIDDIKLAYNFDGLQSFLDLYYLGAKVLITENDFFKLMLAYLCKCKQNNIVHTEIMFDPQTHTQRGIHFDVFMKGFKRAIKQAQQWGITVYLIMSFLRHLSEKSALDTLHSALPYLKDITAVGLDSAELGNPPEKFSRVFAHAKHLGLKRVAHAGEEGPPLYVWAALEILNVDRVDHGVRSIEDEELIETLRTKNIPLTVCPLSNTKLAVFKQMSDHNILELLDSGLCITVNSDDPSYFSGYLNDNFIALIEHLPITAKHIIQLVNNSFNASFLSSTEKEKWLAKIITIANRYL
jgi:adenosine deaminase